MPGDVDLLTQQLRHLLTVDRNVGMKGRIRLARENGVRGGRWMDQSRKQVQAYDYLCHIGEAKE